MAWSSPVTAQNYLKRNYDTDGKEVLRAFAPVVAEARHGVVEFYLGDEQIVLGTVVTADGLVLTKASDLRQGLDEPEDIERELTAQLADGRRVVAQLLNEDRLNDLALVQLEADELRPVTFDLAAPPRLGQWVVVPGLGESPEAVGVMSALPRRVNGVRLGIALGDRQSDGRPVIGMTQPGMGARVAGLQQGDVLVSIAGKPVTNSQDVIDAIQHVIAGDVVEVIVERNGSRLVFGVEMMLPEVDPENSRVDRMNTMGNDISTRRDGFASVLQHDATLAPTECGGPLLDLDGRCVGLNIARAGRIEAYALPAEVVVAALAKMTDQVMVRDADPEAADH
ncbi:MAG: trypsin-like peptidase domain-containing protein [Planctomycetota bacterium]